MTKRTNIKPEQNTKSFGFALPGISLTDTPRKFPWDKPPRLNTPEEALSYVKDILENKGTMDTIVDLLEVGTTPKFIATSIVKAGWAGNLWNPDVAELIKFPVAALVTLIGISAEVDINMDEKEEDKPLKRAKIDLEEQDDMEDVSSEDEEELVEEFKGIMSRK